jgi:hypothetical protein
MTLHMQHIIQHLFRADNLEEVPRERLEALVEEYPSFGLAHYLLSSKLRTEHAEHFEDETRKTNLYFTNPFWLQWLLQQTPLNGVEKRAEEIPVEIPETQAMPPAEEKWVEQPVTEFEAAAPTEAFIEEPVEAVVPQATGPVIEEVKEPVAEHVVEPFIRQTEEPAVGEIAGSVIEQSAEPVAEPFVEPLSTMTVEPVSAGQKIDRPVEEPAIAQPVAEQPLVFESYHMIDYFASQGIKLAPDENPTDRLGKQMKSFTEWLKVMKRLPQKEVGVIPDTVAENKIQAIAAHSNEGKEVVTETMAEVLAKQGMWEKAAEVYRKLSLLNPDKSGYFASKIEQLKTN